MMDKKIKRGLRGRSRTAMICILAAMALLFAGIFTACGNASPSEGAAEERLRSQLADGSVQEVTVNGTLYLHGPVEVSGTKTLKGNGVLKAVGDWTGMEQDYVLVLKEGADITLAESFAVNGNAVSGGVYVSEGAKLTVADQAAVKNAAEAYSNVMAAGTVNVTGGELKDANGHNLYVSGEAVISGGVVKGSGQEFAGVYNAGKLEMTGGEINGAYDNVYVAAGASFLWSIGENLNAVNNGVTVAEGGYLNTTSLGAFMEGAGKQGIHLYGEAKVDDVFLVGSGENCIKIEKTGVMTMTNGAIDGSKGHGITNRGTLTMLGGEITDSAACGILTTGKLEVTSGSIFGSGNQGILVRNGGHAVIKGSTLAVSGNNMGISVEENAYAEVTQCNVNTNSVYNFYSAGELYLHDLTTGGSGSNCMATNYGGHILAENITINGTTRNNGIYNINGSLVELKNVTIDKAKSNGIRNLDAHLVAENLTITNCGREALSIGDYIYQGAGSVKINGLTTSGMAGSNMAVDIGCTGTIEITNGKLGMAGTNNLKVQGGKVFLTDVELLGNKPGGNSTHGILMDEGAKITAKNLLICDTVASGIRNRGGEFVGDHVVMRNIAVDGISNVPHGTTKNPGSVTIHDLYTTGVKGSNVKSECLGGAVYLTDSTLGKCNTNSVRVNKGLVSLNSVVIEGHTDNPKEGNQHGIFIDNGEVLIKNVTIQNTDAAGLRISGGSATVTGSVFQNTGANGVFQSGGVATLNGVTIENNKGDAIGVTGGTLKGSSVTAKGVPGNGINQTGGAIDMGMIDLTGTGTNNAGLKTTGGTFKAETLNLTKFRDGIFAGEGTDADKKTIPHGGSVTVTTGGIFAGLTRNGLGIGGTLTVDLTGVIMDKPATSGVNTWNEKSAVILTDCTIDGAYDSVYLTSGSVTMNGGKIINSEQEAVEMNGGSFTSYNTDIDKARDVFSVKGGSVSVNDGTVKNINRHGLNVGGICTIELNGVTLENPAQNGINMWKAGDVTLTDTTITGSGNEGILLSAGTVTVNGNSIVAGCAKEEIKNNGGSVILNGGYICGDVNNSKGNLTIGKVTVGYDAGGASTGGKITSSNMINFAGDAVSDIHASGKKIELDINENANNTQLVQFESNEIALSLMDNFNASGKPLGVDDKILFVAVAIAEVDGKQYSSLDKAIEAAHKTGSSGIITLLENVNADKTYDIAGNVTITGEKTITRTAQKTLFSVKSGGMLTLQGNLVVTDGQTKTYNVITAEAGAALNVTNVNFNKLYSGNNDDAVICAKAGSAVAMNGATFTETQGMVLGLRGAPKQGTAFSFTNCTFEKTNASGAWGGVASIATNAATNFTGCTFANNTAKAGGVACVSGASVTFADCSFSGNKGINQAGAIYVEDKNGADGIVTVTGGSFQNNVAGNNSDKTGGAIYAIGAQVDISGTSFTGNKGKWGGTVYLTGATLNVTGASFTGNDANGTQGAAIFAEAASTVNVSDSAFSGNAAGTGKDIYMKDAASNLTISGATKAEDIYLKEADTINIPDALGSDAVLVLNAPVNTVVQFKDSAALEADASKISLAAANQHFQYDPAKATATIVAGEADPVAQIGIYGYNTLAEAVEKAQNGDVITLIKNAVVDSTITIDKTVTITDNGTAKTISRGSDFTGAMFSVQNTTLNMKATAANNLVLDGKNISASDAAIAAGQNGIIAIDGVKFVGNTRTDAGSAINANGAYLNQAKLTINNATFDGNSATGEGGAIYMRHCTANFSNCLFQNNGSTSYGGVMSLHDYTTVTVNNSGFTNNTAQNNGGAIIMASDANSGYGLTLNGCTFTGNSAKEGGAIYAWKETGLTLDGCSFSGNTASSTPAGNDVHFRMNGSDSKESLTVKTSGTSPINVSIYIQTGCMNKVFVPGTLVDGSNIIFNWSDPENGYNLTFDSAAAAEANYDNIALAASLEESYHLVYSDNVAKLAAGKDTSVARVGYTGYDTLAEAVAAADGKTVILMSDVTLDSTVDVTGNVTITDDGTARTITRASGFTGTMFNVTGSLTLDGLTLNGNAITGTAPAVDAKGGNLTMQNVTVTNFKSASGVPVVKVYGTGGSLTMTGGSVESNTVTGYCGTIGIWDSPAVNISNVVFKSNTCTGNTGNAALYLNGSGTYTVSNCTFDGNNGYNGGAIAIAGSNNTTISGCTFKNNKDNNRRGSSIYVDNCKATVNINGCSFESNQHKSLTVHGSGKRTVSVNGTVVSVSGKWTELTDDELKTYTQTAALMLDEEPQNKQEVE